MLKIANLKDIPQGKALILRIPDGGEVALFNISGKIYALNNACPHKGGPLGEGEIEGCCVTCPWHAWQFDVKTGACINLPGYDASPLPIQIQDGEIFLKE